MISNYTNHKMWNEITYPFPNFNGCTVEVWEWIRNFILYFTEHVITYPGPLIFSIFQEICTRSALCYVFLWFGTGRSYPQVYFTHDDVIKWKHFPRYWPFVRGIHRFPHKGQWRGVLMFSLIYVSINGWENDREAGDLRRYRSHYDVIVMRHWTHLG